MTWKDLIGLVIIIIGVILFLYGSNAYDALVGWSGFFLIISGIVFEIVFEVYKVVRKRES
ncbi:MAG TPA: hypothetical protein VMT01_01800 [Candidatus Acidoferrum sp.]|jgi:uncharacterized membrane protein HdeD (DUF308 family)|nr:hypothetical protein [Candidatus Acidoferrum sp.]